MEKSFDWQCGIVNKFGYYLEYSASRLYNYPVLIAKYTVDDFGNLVKVKEI